MIIFGKAILEKHQTPRYLWNRFRVWVNSLLRPNEPWMPRKAVLILEEIIRPTDKILEFGSGRSTLWFAERCQVLTSVEHNKDWYEQVKKQLKNQNNVNYRFEKWLKDEYVSSPYLKYLQSLDNESIDVIVNDGKLRDYIAIEGAKKLKSGGFMVIDNAERYFHNHFSTPESLGYSNKPYGVWPEFIELSENWRRIWTTNGVTCNLILFKP